MKHGDKVLKSGCSFIPLVVESLGCWAKSSLETLKIIASFQLLFIIQLLA